MPNTFISSEGFKGKLCVEQQQTQQHKYFPFDLNLSVCGEEFIDNLLTNYNHLINLENKYLFEARLKILNFMYILTNHLKLDGLKLKKALIEKLKSDSSTSSYIRLFQRGDYGRNIELDYKTRINDSIGLFMCILYFSKQSLRNQR